MLEANFFELTKQVPDSLQGVLGGSCICYAKGNPARLSLQDLIDSLLPTLVAAREQCPVWLYFQSFEAIMMADLLHYDAQQADYTTMREWLEKGIRLCLSKLDITPPPIHWIDTAMPVVHDRLDQHTALLRKMLPPARLWGLYSQKDGAIYPKDTPEEQIMLDVYYRNIALYTPGFLSATLDCNPQQVLFVENTTQKKAIEIYYKQTKGTVGMMLYPPTPNAHGKEMCLGNNNHKIELRHSSAQIEHRASRIDHPDYYQQVLGHLTINEVMTSWQSEVGL
ncbi:hypothetical protein DP187_21775 [Enterobacter cloacae]|nr:hypothetical protein DP187_21775 [Enterobacter cloacae]